MSEQIDHRVTQALHTESLTVLDGYNEDSVKLIGDAVSAFWDAYVTIGKVHTAKEAAERDPTMTPEQRVLLVSKEADKQQARLLRKMDTALAYTTKAADHLERELSLPVTSKASLNVAQEIRAHAKSLDGKQADFLRERIMAGDELTVSALLGAPSYLSGMTDDAQAVFTRMWHEQQNPTQAARLKLLRATADKIERHGPLVMLEMQKAVGAKPGDVRNIDAAHNATLAALKIEPTV
jgi:hypothetical protein